MDFKTRIKRYLTAWTGHPRKFLREGGVPLGLLLVALIFIDFLLEFPPYPLDILCGSAATLIACLMTQRMPNRWLAPLPPVLCNMVIVGAEIAWYLVGFGPGFLAAYALNAFTVGVGELIACVILGQLLLTALPKVPVLRPFIPERRLANI